MVTTNTLPSNRLLAPFPRLDALFRPLCEHIRRGDLAGFDAAISAGGSAFTKRMIFLPIERGRDLAIRNLFRKVFLAGGYDPPTAGMPPIRRTRIPIKEFVAAVRLKMKDGKGFPVVPPPKKTVISPKKIAKKEEKNKENDEKLTAARLRMEIDQVECYMANLIHKVSETSNTLWAL